MVMLSGGLVIHAFASDFDGLLLSVPKPAHRPPATPSLVPSPDSFRMTFIDVSNKLPHPRSSLATQSATQNHTHPPLLSHPLLPSSCWETIMQKELHTELPTTTVIHNVLIKMYSNDMRTPKECPRQQVVSCAERPLTTENH